MTHDDRPPQAILDLVDNMRELEQRAALQYRPAVDGILQELFATIDQMPMRRRR